MQQQTHATTNLNHELTYSMHATRNKINVVRAYTLITLYIRKGKVDAKGKIVEERNMLASSSEDSAYQPSEIIIQHDHFLKLYQISNLGSHNMNVLFIYFGSGFIFLVMHMYQTPSMIAILKLKSYTRTKHKPNNIVASNTCYQE